MKYLISIISVVFFIFLEVRAQEVTFPVTNYTTKDYGRDFNPSNMAIAQDKRGIIYVANGFKLLEFDGHTWNSYPINKETFILSLAIDSSGIVYAGSQNEFGYFAPDKKGELKYVSLSDSLDITDMDFTNIWKVHAFSGGIVFQAEEKLFLYRNRKTEVIKPATSFHTSFIVNDILYVRQRGVGLMEWKENSLIKIKGGEIFDTSGIFMMLPFGRNNKKILVGTQEKGLWQFEPGNTSAGFHKIKADDPSLFENSRITGGVLIANGSIAVSTLLNGLIVLDTTGKTRTIINKSHGLSDNGIKQVMEDQSHNLWLALNNGISKVEINSPLSIYSEKDGITGSINALIRYRNQFFAGTNSGLFAQRPDDGSGIQFQPAVNFNVPVRCLIEADGRLLAGTDGGLFQYSDQKFQKIGDELSFVLWYSPEMKLLLSGGPKGLTIYRKEESFKKLSFLNDIREDIIGITGETTGTSDSLVCWIGTRYNDGAIRLKIYKNLSSVSDRYNTSDGLPTGPVTPYTLNRKTRDTIKNPGTASAVPGSI